MLQHYTDMLQYQNEMLQHYTYMLQYQNEILQFTTLHQHVAILN